MPRTDTDSLTIRRTTRADGLEVARQPPPPGAASFSATYVAPAGWAFDPPGRAGTARMLAGLLTSGAGRRNRVELARELDRLGASLSAHAAPESVEVTMWGPHSALDDLLPILGDVVLRPGFAESDVERVRRQMNEQQLRETTQPDHRAEREMLRLLFPPDHPYRETGVGTRTTVGRIRGRDLRRFHRDQFTSAGSLFVVTARRSLPELERLSRRTMAKFPTEASPAPHASRGTRRQSPRRRDIPMDGRSQVELRLGGASVSRSSPEFPSVFLANEVLGGRPMLSRLFQRVRERAGLAYHASSDLEAMRWGGYWEAQAGTGPERVERTLALLRLEVDRLAGESLPSSELNRIRESAIGELPLELETTADAHELAVDVAYHHLPDDFLSTWPGMLRRLTPREVRRGAEVGLNGASASTVVVGMPTSGPRRRR